MAVKCFRLGAGRAIVLRVKALVRAVGLVVAVLALILLGHTFRRGAAPRATGSAPHTEAVDEGAVADHLSKAIQFRTVSHQDPKDDDHSVFAAFRAFLEATYPK